MERKLTWGNKQKITKISKSKRVPEWTRCSVTQIGQFQKDISNKKSKQLIKMMLKLIPK